MRMSKMLAKMSTINRSGVTMKAWTLRRALLPTAAAPI
eukprot:CAMPEP_0185575564 /NCGR_PEP_ID=MMETSP0434-20130131/6722_1 /TAXON_ID=626734 ORGANISM="Favella taraikaensis, Strain Fe Narragansett Bay" /NCGR_SAMPLE_ID=MMETSP0434 /ASSEMBLY_ACC=CAM_ASM_000379 /LENGTH=37 /DNA_ID= /DNA_START= /DNA_END= /DNA_ORIENTATION=